jgi:pyridoxamine 5'-phosphate oxidase
VDQRGVVFYTNYTSAKSHDLRASRYASATFPWYSIRRQVHVRGPVELVTPEETQKYWATRPRGSQLGAWASAQSTVVRDRRSLDDALDAATRRFADEPEVPTPPHWGGWRLVPEQVEFWQGRANRMHDRLRFEVDGHDRTWTVRRPATVILGTHRPWETGRVTRGWWCAVADAQVTAPFRALGEDGRGVCPVVVLVGDPGAEVVLVSG